LLRRLMTSCCGCIIFRNERVISVHFPRTQSIVDITPFICPRDRSIAFPATHFLLFSLLSQSHITRVSHLSRIILTVPRLQVCNNQSFSAMRNLVPHPHLRSRSRARAWCPSPILHLALNHMIGVHQMRRTCNTAGASVSRKLAERGVDGQCRLSMPRRSLDPSRHVQPARNFP
jgi:hypothetical protein